MDIKEILLLDDREEAFMCLAKLYFDAPEDLRDDLRNRWDFDVQWIYPDQTKLACSIDERWPSVTKIKASLIYYSISSNSCDDERDVLIAFAVIYHSCKAAGLDGESLFMEVANISDIKIKKWIVNFISRKEEDKSMDAFMLNEKINMHGEKKIVPLWLKDK